MSVSSSVSVPAAQPGDGDDSMLIIGLVCCCLVCCIVGAVGFFALNPSSSTIAPPATQSTNVPTPAQSTQSCLSVGVQYGVQPLTSWGSLTDPALKQWWNNNNCNCPYLQQRYGIIPSQSFGTADSKVSAAWNALGCNTKV